MQIVAAMRSTESRLSNCSELLLSELGQGRLTGCRLRRHFAGPKMLPARLPNILLNGTTVLPSAWRPISTA
ncbi:hypothetical protein ACNKHR_17660 [Shigella flexneri]